jgi:hypothetical protein
MKTIRNISPWIPLMLSIPLVYVLWLPGAGPLVMWAPIFLLGLGILSVILQGRGARVLATSGLLVGFILPWPILFLQKPPVDPGPGEGLVLIFYFFGMLWMGIALSTFVGFWARRRGRQSLVT